MVSNAQPAQSLPADEKAAESILQGFFEHAAVQRDAKFRAFEAAFSALWSEVSVAHALWPLEGVKERQRLVSALERDVHTQPAFVFAHKSFSRSTCERTLRRLVEELEHLPEPWQGLYAARLQELDLEIGLRDSLHQPKRIAPMARRLFGDGAQLIEGQSVLAWAQECVANVIDDASDETLSYSDYHDSIVATLRKHRLAFSVRLHPHMTAKMAVTEHEVWVQGADLKRSELAALLRHEVAGHAVSQQRANAQTLTLLKLGTSRAFAGQEGLCLGFEAEHRPHAGEDFHTRLQRLPSRRLRALAARVCCTELMRSGMSFFEVARHAYREFGCSSAEAVVLSERAFRGGGLGREIAYFIGYFDVQNALAEGLPIAAMQVGKVGVNAAHTIWQAAAQRAF